MRIPLSVGELHKKLRGMSIALAAYLGSQATTVHVKSTTLGNKCKERLPHLPRL